MGGGDLNLKKSWHPSTLRNIERVWKAEQKHEVERQKIEQLQRELAEERAREEIQAYAEGHGVVKKKEERLDWMYQGPAAMVNRDEYLMGRKIDKTFELLQQQENGAEAPKTDGYDVGATMFSSQDLSGTATVDLANKIREDPLFSIMKKEKEQRKNLLTNPVRMKQLQQLLQESLTKKKSKKNKKDKKKPIESSDSDDECHKRRKKEKKDAKREQLLKRRSPQYEQRPSKTKSRDHYRNHDSNHDSDKNHRNHDSNHDSDKNHRNHDSNHDSDKNHFNSYGSNYKESYYSSDHRNSHYRHSSTDKNLTSHERHSKQSYSQDHKRDFNKDSGKRKLDADERKRRLQEMQENAKWREEQQKRIAKKFKDDDDKEEATKMIDSTDFLKPLLSKAAGKGSVENRIKQRIFSIQRSSAAMDKNFARR